MQGRHPLNNQQGFTLIEIIAVLVLIGILAAVAVPKYMDLQAEGKIKTAGIELAELKGQFSQAYGNYILKNNGTTPTTAQVVTEAGYVAGAQDVGTSPDIWNITLTTAATKITILINSHDGDAGYTTTADWMLPQ